MKILPLLLPVLAAVSPLSAQICSTISGSTVPDGPVNAVANFTVGDGFITVAVSNLFTGPKSVGQLLSGLQFTLASGKSTGTLGSNSANVRRVDKGGGFTDLGPSATGWALETSNSTFVLCALCTDLGALGPKRLLIGDPNTSTQAYTSANGSIAGNKPHNPFTTGTAVFLINAPTVVVGDSVSNATFFFGSDGGASGVPGVGVAAAGTCSGIIPQ